MTSVLEKAHKHSIHHRAEIEASDKVGCFCCRKVFSWKDVTEWVDDGETAMCPYCGIDAVLGSASAYPITQEFLEQMQIRWFGEQDDDEG